MCGGTSEAVAPLTLGAHDPGTAGAVAVELPDGRRVNGAGAEIPYPPERGRAELSRLLVGRAAVRIRVAADLMVLYVAAIGALLVAPSTSRVAVRVLLAAVFPPLVVGILQTQPWAKEHVHRSALETAISVVGVVSVAGMLVVVTGSILGVTDPAGLASPFWLFSLVALAAVQLVVLAATRNPSLATPTLVIGAGAVGGQLVRRLASDPRYGLRPVGLIDSHPMMSREQLADVDVPFLGAPAELRNAVTLTGARHVILAFSGDPDRVLAERVQECQELGVEISVVPRLYECINDHATLEYVGGLPLVALRPTNPQSWQFAVKHALDRILAFVALVILGPLMATLALAVAATSGRPVIFRQRRIGRDGQEFGLLKFRTMRDAVTAPSFIPPAGCAPGGIEGEDRRTRLGRFLRDSSLDELPQLVNVLRGEMSLVGPRPERPEFVERFGREVIHYGDRHRVKSGITGWAQVNGLRGQTSIADRVEWDNHYIQNWSLGFDFRILVLTVAELLRLRRRD